MSQSSIVTIPAPKPIEPGDRSPIFTNYFGITYDIRKLTSASILRIVFLALLLLSREGIPAVFVGLPVGTTNYLLSLLILAAVGKWLITDAIRLNTIHYVFHPIAFFVYCVGVAAFSSTFFFNYDAREWVIGQYLIVPILVPVMYYTFGYSAKEIAYSLILGSTIGSLLIIIDQFFILSQLDVFYRRSVNAGGDFRRIVFMKNEITWTTLYFIVYFMLNLKSNLLKKNFFKFTIFFLNAYALIQVIESRLAIASVLLGASALVLFGRIGSRRRAILIWLGLILAFTILPFALDKYIRALTDTQDYFRTGNVNIRLYELDYFWDYFLKTSGIGFGILSAGPSFSNLIAQGAWYSAHAYSFYVEDLGILGALVQFGVIGFAWVIYINLSCLARFLKAGRNPDNPHNIIAITSFCYLFGGLLSPWPMNYFTLSWTVLTGWTLWYLSYAVQIAVPAARATDRRC